MSDVKVTAALAMIEHGLRDDVLPHVADSHAAAGLRAALTMVRNVRAELEAGNAWRVKVLETALPLARGWPNAIRSYAPEAAERAAACMAGAGTDVARAHELLMETAKICFEAIWQQPSPDRELLAQLRQVTRLDAEARAAIAR